MKKTVEINETMNLSNQHLMALDYGQKFIGVALFYVGRDPFPTPYERIVPCILSEVYRSKLRVADLIQRYQGKSKQVV